MAKSISRRLEKAEQQIERQGDADYLQPAVRNPDGSYRVAGKTLTEAEFQVWEERGRRLGKLHGPVLVVTNLGPFENDPWWVDR